MKPFGLEFFGVLLLKALLHITIKGGLMFKLHTKLRAWLHCYYCLDRDVPLNSAPYDFLHANPSKILEALINTLTPHPNPKPYPAKPNPTR